VNPSPRYRATELVWPTRIPEHWKIKRLRFAAQTNPVLSKANLALDTMVSFTPMEAIGENGGLDLTREKAIDEIGSGYTYYSDGDVIVAKITPCFENGKGALASRLKNGVALGTTELHVLRPNAELNDRYLFYVTISHGFRKLGEAHMYGAGGQKRVPELFIKDLRAPAPPLDEQSAIARFLDAKTAQIDELIAKKERLLQLLSEKRTAIITKAVTEGLNTSAPRRDSGSPLLRVIPADWKIERLKFHTTRIGSGKTPRGGAETYVSSGVVFLRSQNVHFDGLHLDEVAYIDELVDAEMASTRVSAGDVLLNITGASLGRACMVPGDLASANVNQHVCIVRPDKATLDSEFLWRMLSSQFVQDQIFGIEQGVSRDALTFEQVGDLAICIPPKDHQRQISEYIKTEMVELSDLATTIRRTVHSLTEYRKLLVNSAVIGHIDVRYHKPAVAAQ